MTDDATDSDWGHTASGNYSGVAANGPTSVTGAGFGAMVADEVTGDPGTHHPLRRGRQEAEEATQLFWSPEPARLYPNPGSGVLTRAFSLLGRLRQYTSTALEALDDGDLMASDDAVTMMALELPDLFCMRQIGDGFGALAASLLAAARNRGAKPLTAAQLGSIEQVLDALVCEPQMPFEDAVALVERLHSAGLRTSSHESEEFATLLLDEGMQ